MFLLFYIVVSCVLITITQEKLCILGAWSLDLLYSVSLINICYYPFFIMKEPNTIET